jgi:hypothetical protein
MARPVLVSAVKDIELCGDCANELTAIERKAVAPLIVAAFAQFMADWSATPPTQACGPEGARHFWASLTPFRDTIDVDDVARALETLIARAPRRAATAENESSAHRS